MKLVGSAVNDTLGGSEGSDLIYGFNPEGAGSDVGSIAATRVASGLSQPLFAGAPPGDLGRLFIVEKTGLIKILDLASGQVLATPFLNVSGQILADGERGLLGLAFHPDFAQNGLFYVNLINTNGDTEIRRYQVSAADRNQADPGSATLVIRIDQPDFSNHKAGWIDFGPDGYLYASLGDGGSANDPLNNAQNLDSLLGKMLRLDANADAFPGDTMRNYAIPADNPFVGIAGADEIWALGLRNPWRASFDRGTGDLYIADVGQQRWEEVDLGRAGANYGWKIFEGPEQVAGGTPSGGTLTAPIYYYAHGSGASIIGGYVYRGTSDGLQGDYFFADSVTGKISTLDQSSGAWVPVDRTSQIHTDTGSISMPVSFGQDGAGNLYVVDLGGSVYRLTPGTNIQDQADVLNGFGGNDMLFGGPGNDILDGGPGVDTLIGSTQDDTYYVNTTADVVVESAAAGIDSVISQAVFFALAPNVEYLVLDQFAGHTSGNGNAAANTLIGNAGNNSLYGLGGADLLLGGDGSDYLLGMEGDDVLYAGGSSWTDTLEGGTGNDIYEINNGASAVIERPGEGADAVRSSAAFTVLASNVENLVLLGAVAADANGNDLANLMTGNAGRNSLYGFAGNDTLVGGDGSDILLGMQGNDSMEGGSGNDWFFAGDHGQADVLAGGTGDDLYVLYSSGSTITENPGEGSGDTIMSVAPFMVIAANVEYLVLDAAAGNASGNGDASANVLIGNASANSLYGFGGADLVLGGDGSDFVFGMGGNDVLYAGGAAWTDTLEGGTGDDVYEVYNANSTITENPGEGTDTARSGAGYTVLWNNVENLVLLDAINSGANGNALGNVITGNAGNNSLYGFGGNDSLSGGNGADFLLGMDGNDTLVGGAGNDSHSGGAGSDTFDFNAVAEGLDTVTDFTAGGGGDKLDIRDLLVGYNSGTSAIGDFVQLSESGGLTTVSVDANGPVGGASFNPIASLQGVTGLVLNDMLANGNLIVH